MKRKDGVPWAVTWDANRRDTFMANRQLVRLTNFTRRLLRATYHEQKKLKRLEKLRARFQWRKERAEIRTAIKQSRAEKRKPALRARSRNNMNRVVFPTCEWRMYNTYAQKYMGQWEYGDKGAMVDYHPILKLDPPRNWTYAQRTRANSLSASVSLDLGPANRINLPACKLGLIGLKAYPMTLDITKPLTFNNIEADNVLMKAQAKVYDAAMHMNEYVYEWRQVLMLLKDPYRTALKFARRIDKWVSRDSWIYLPSRTARKLTNGSVLISKRPTGAMLMSMRTRRVIDPVGVSKEVLDAACNRWLQYRYGIRPLVQDINTIMGMLVDSVPPPLLRKESARSWVTKTSVTSEYSYAMTPLSFKFKVTKKSGVVYSAKQWYTQDDDATPMSYKTGMHPSQFVRAMWNWIPYSFVADWIVNVDAWLAAITDVPWIKLAANVVTAKEFEHVSSRLISVTYFASPYNRCKIDGDPIGTAYSERMYRQVDRPRITSAMSPSVSRAWQSVKNAATALALIHQLKPNERGQYHAH